MTLSQQLARLAQDRRALAELMAERAPEAPRPADQQAFDDVCRQIRTLVALKNQRRAAA